MKQEVKQEIDELLVMQLIGYIPKDIFCKEKSPIFELLNKYFTQEEVIEFIYDKKIERLEKEKQTLQGFDIFSLINLNLDYMELVLISQTLKERLETIENVEDDLYKALKDLSNSIEKKVKEIIGENQ